MSGNQNRYVVVPTVTGAEIDLSLMLRQWTGVLRMLDAMWTSRGACCSAGCHEGTPDRCHQGPRAAEEESRCAHNALQVRCCTMRAADWGRHTNLACKHSTCHAPTSLSPIDCPPAGKSAKRSSTKRPTWCELRAAAAECGPRGEWMHGDCRGAGVHSLHSWAS